MKLIAILAAGCFFSIAGHAQSWTATLSTGAAIPVGRYATDNHTGSDLNLGANYEFFHHLGIGILADFLENPVFSGLQFEGVVAGPSYRLPLNEAGRWILTARVMGGISDHYDYNSKSKTDEEPVFVNHPWNPPTNFVYRAGAGIEFHPGKHWFIVANTDFSRIFILQDFVFLVPTGYNNTAYYSDWAVVRLNTLNLTAGVGLRF